MNKNRAIITGIGPVTVLGSGLADFEASLFSDEMPVWAVNNGVGSYAVAESDLDLARYGDDMTQFKLPKHTDRVTDFSIVASLLALQDAGLLTSLNEGKVPTRDSARWAVTYGSALSSFSQAEAGHEKYLLAKQEGKKVKTKPSVALELLHSTPSSQIAMLLGITGQTTAHANSCAAGHTSLIEAQRLVELGLADVVIAGATECPISGYTADTLKSLKVVSSQTKMQPCSVGRDGFVMSEGAAFFVVESEAHAQARGAKMYAEIKGSAIGNEAAHMTQPRDEGVSVAQVMNQALNAADVWSTQIDLAVLHASATPQNDKNEGLAMAKVFEALGEPQPLAVALKARFGHSLGSASAIQVAAILLMMQRNETPYLGLEGEVEESLGLKLEPSGAKLSLDTVISNAFGFGGVNSSLVFAKL